jgi:hypothetical protein
MILYTLSRILKYSRVRRDMFGWSCDVRARIWAGNLIYIKDGGSDEREDKR